MSNITHSEPIERSVDSMQSIYSVVFALAIAEAIQSLLKGPSGTVDFNLVLSTLGLPAFVAFLVTLVPFWHGMNRHLDRCYLEKSADIVQGALLIDFSMFFVEATFLFAAGWSLKSGIDSFRYLGLLLCVDMLWAYASHLIHFPNQKSHARRWIAINLVALPVAILIVLFPFQQKPLALMMIAVLRSVVDYWLCWDFYFPPATS